LSSQQSSLFEWLVISERKDVQLAILLLGGTPKKKHQHQGLGCGQKLPGCSKKKIVHQLENPRKYHFLKTTCKLVLGYVFFFKEVHN